MSMHAGSTSPFASPAHVQQFPAREQSDALAHSAVATPEPVDVELPVAEEEEEEEVVVAPLDEAVDPVTVDALVEVDA